MASKIDQLAGLIQDQFARFNARLDALEGGEFEAEPETEAPTHVTINGVTLDYDSAVKLGLIDADHGIVTASVAPAPTSKATTLPSNPELDALEGQIRGERGGNRKLATLAKVFDMFGAKGIQQWLQGYRFVCPNCGDVVCRDAAGNTSRDRAMQAAITAACRGDADKVWGPTAYVTQPHSLITKYAQGIMAIAKTGKAMPVAMGVPVAARKTPNVSTRQPSARQVTRAANGILARGKAMPAARQLDPTEAAKIKRAVIAKRRKAGKPIDDESIKSDLYRARRVARGLPAVKVPGQP